MSLLQTIKWMCPIIVVVSVTGYLQRHLIIQIAKEKGLFGAPLLRQEPLVSGFRVLDRYNETMYRSAEGGLSRFVDYEDIPKRLIEAFICVEDRRFRDHIGIDVYSIIRAGWANLMAGEIEQGASTITQQLARLLFLDRERTLTRKIREAFFALVMEAHHSKSQILEAYLNNIFLGNFSVGVRSASINYFRKDLRELNSSEMAILAGLPRAPSLYAPHRYPDRARDRLKSVKRKFSECNINLEDWVPFSSLKIYKSPLHTVEGLADFQRSVTHDLKEKWGGHDGRIVVHTGFDTKIARTERKIRKEILGDLIKKSDSKMGLALLGISPASGEVRILADDFVGSQRGLDLTRKKQPLGDLLSVFTLTSLVKGGLELDGFVSNNHVLQDILKYKFGYKKYLNAGYIGHVSQKYKLEYSPKKVEGSPLQVALFFASLVNGGLECSPVFVNRWRIDNNDSFYFTDTCVPRRIMTEQEAYIVLYALAQSKEKSRYWDWFEDEGYWAVFLDSQLVLVAWVGKMAGGKSLTKGEQQIVLDYSNALVEAISKEGYSKWNLKVPSDIGFRAEKSTEKEQSYVPFRLKL